MFENIKIPLEFEILYLICLIQDVKSCVLIWSQ